MSGQNPSFGTSQERSTRGAVKLADIAARVGVTVAMVSNAYNRPKKLSEALRTRIFEVAEELGYSGPDPVARSLRGRRTGAIGWFIPASLSYAVTDPATLLFFQGMAEELGEARVGLLILPSSAEAAPDVSVVRNAIVDGFIVTFARDDPLLKAVLARGLPIVVVEQPRLEGVRSVFVEQELGAHRAASHITGLGHVDVGVILLRTGHDNFIGEVTNDRRKDISYEITADRLRGYLSGLAEAGVDADIVPMYEPMSTREGGKEAARWLLARQPRPTAILAMSDELALGAIDVAWEMGLRVPDDLSIIGFDGAAGASTSHPPLTTVEQPLREKGALAVRMLLWPEQFHDNAVILPTKLVVRHSTAPPSSTARRQ